MRSYLGAVTLVLVCGLAADAQEPGGTPAVVWRSDYHEALDEAEVNGRLALIWFFDAAAADANEKLKLTVLEHRRVAARLERDFVVAALPTTTRVMSGGEEVRLLGHAAFAEMLGRPGLAIVDMRNKESPFFRQVVSTIPFDRQEISLEHFLTLLTLPSGSLTQRSLIYAVRRHPERPASANCELSPILMSESEKHADYQASLTLQGHHHWESRFHAINARLPGGLIAQEVCAESWPGQTLLEAAIECVDSWRQSPGHWEAVSGKQELFGYDMKRGRNGTWYATGIFARRH